MERSLPGSPTGINLRDMPVLQPSGHYVGPSRRPHIVRYLEFALRFILSERMVKNGGKLKI